MQLSVQFSNSVAAVPNTGARKRLDGPTIKGLLNCTLFIDEGGVVDAGRGPMEKTDIVLVVLFATVAMGV